MKNLPVKENNKPSHEGLGVGGAMETANFVIKYAKTTLSAGHLSFIKLVLFDFHN
jgi:hypothetical protein